MLKRTKGRLLLSLLVVTGFAGTLNTSSLSNGERKQVVVSLKENKSELLKNLRNLSVEQLNYRGDNGGPTIRERLQHVLSSELNLSRLAEGAMRHPARPEDRAKITVQDEDILYSGITSDCTYPANKSIDTKQSATDIVNALKASQSKQLKYVKTTTEDLRNRVVETSIGSIDCYQVLLYLSRHTNMHLSEIAGVLQERSGRKFKP